MDFLQNLIAMPYPVVVTQASIRRLSSPEMGPWMGEEKGGESMPRGFAAAADGDMVVVVVAAAAVVVGMAAVLRIMRAMGEVDETNWLEVVKTAKLLQNWMTLREVMLVLPLLRPKLPKMSILTWLQLSCIEGHG